MTVTPEPELDRSLLAVRDVSVTFETAEGPVRVLDSVSLDVGRGESVGIVGESGSGKTVFVRRIMGLVAHGSRTQVAGRITFAGQELSALSRGELRRLWGSEIAMIFQDAMTALNPVKRIGVQITEIIREHRDVSRRAARERAAELLRSVGIADAPRRLRQYPHELSGGMRQRVTIAIALACDPRLVFADEPTTALDVTVQAQILRLLDQQQAERGMSLVLVTHDLGVAAEHTDRIVVMYSGRIVEIANSASLVSRPAMPYTEALLASIPRPDDEPHSRLKAIPGRPPNLLDPPTGCRFSPRCAYATSRCHDEEPPLVSSADSTHLFRCWYPLNGHSAAQTPVPSAAAMTATTVEGS